MSYTRILALLFSAVLLGAVLSSGQESRADRLKDIANVLGARPNQLVGYGIVVGLNNTGDGRKAEFTLQSVAAMLRRLGVRIEANKIQLKNAAAVMVTAELPAFVRPGQRIDVLVSSLGDAKSLRGGTLIQTPLLGADRRVYAVAQGAISVGGFSADGKGSSKTQGHPTAGRIPMGALVETEVPTAIDSDGLVQLALKSADALTAQRMAEAVNSRLGKNVAIAEDPGLVSVKLPKGYGNAVRLLAEIGDLDIPTDAPAKVIINERTGTVVVGAAVQLRPAAIAHGGLTVEIRESTLISQPTTPFTGGETVIAGQTTVSAQTAAGELHLVPGAATVGDLVNALNALGVKPSDLIVIFQALSAAGALSADVEVQ
jgi:flagellar P-ring protein precursor FlgI